MKKQTFNRIFWAFVALGLCTLVCVQWFSTGCGWQSLVAAVSFYGVLSAGLMIAVEDVMERR